MTSDPVTPGAHGETPASPARRLRRPLLWVLFAIASTANAITSVSSLPAAVGAAFGVLALTLGVLLFRDYRRHRKA